MDGVFEEVAGEGSADAAMQVSASGVVFHPATGIDATPVAQVQTTLQKRILRAFVARGLLENCDAKDMLGYKHSGFSVDAGVCIEAHDRAALERLLRYCARPPFSMERLRKEGSKLVYRCGKQRSEPTSDKRGAKVDELHLTPLELINRIAALVPPPRTHRHRYFGVHPANTSWCAMPTEDLLAHKRVAVHSACRTTVPAPRRSTCRDFRPVKKGVAGSRLRRPVDPR